MTPVEVVVAREKQLIEELDRNHAALLDIEMKQHNADLIMARIGETVYIRGLLMALEPPVE